MGLSSNILLNNIEIYMVLSFLLLKMLVVKKITGCFSEEFRKKFGLNFNPVKVFIYEFIPLSPFMVVSAMTNLLNFEVSNPHEKANVIGHVVTLFLCVFLIAVFHVIATSRLADRKKRKQKNR